MSLFQHFSLFWNYIICYEARKLTKKEAKIAQRQAAQILLLKTKIQIRILAECQPLYQQGTDKKPDQEGGLQLQPFSGSTSRL